MSFKRYDTKQIGKWTDGNIEQADYLYNLVLNTSDFKAAVEPEMSAICIRYQPAGITEEALTKLHHNVVRKVEQGGKTGKFQNAQ